MQDAELTDKEKKALIFAAAASGETAYLLMPTHDRIKYQYEWERPSGERIRMKGFSPSEISNLRPTMGNIDKSLADNVYLSPMEGLTITKRRSILYAGSSRPSTSELGLYADYYPKGSLGNKINKAADKRAREKGISNPAEVSLNSLIGAKTSRSTLAHEIGHRVDRQGISQSSAWKRATKGGRDVPKANYQAVGAHEDFAETFRASLGYMDKGDPVLLNKRRIKFMENNIFNNPSGKVGEVRAIHGPHEHINLFVGAGAAAATGVAYGAHRYTYKHNAEYAKNWDRRRAAIVPGTRFDKVGSIKREIRANVHGRNPRTRTASITR